MEGQSDRPWGSRRRLIPSPMECFVLLVIICVLAFLMLSASGAPRELARRSVCMRNLKEIGLAMKLYAEDHGGRFPCDLERTTVGSLALLPGKYPKNHTQTRARTLYDAFVCPDDVAHVFARIAPGSPKKPLTSKNVSYAYGGFVFVESLSPDSPLACDRSSTGTWTNSRPWNKNKWTHGSSGGNVLLADGRVSFTKWKVGTMDAMKNP